MSKHPSLQEFFDSPGALAADLNMSASASEPLTQDELLAFEPEAAARFNEIKLTYPRRHAELELLDGISRRYRAVPPEGLLPTSGVDEALGMLFLSLVEAGDRVVVLTPCLSDVSVPGTNWAVFVREDFWLIVETEGNEDEAEIHDIERPGREGCTGHSAQDASQIFL